MLCLLLNERSRELCGEFHRWQDLSRTLTLVERAKAFNPDAAPIFRNVIICVLFRKPTWMLSKKDGHALTPEEKKAEQNPGY